MIPAPGPAGPRGRTQLIYAVGDVPNALKTVLAGLFGMYFYTTVMGLPGSLVGLAAAIGLAWDAIIDPYVGYLSDRSRGRLGRRHGFMLAGALTMGIGFWASFGPPRGLSTAALFAWLLGTGFLVRTATSVYRVPYLALGAELAQDYDQRTAITALRGSLSLAGTLLGAALSFVVFFPNRDPGVDPKLHYPGYPLMGLAVGAAMTVLGLIATLGTLDRGPGTARHAAASPPPRRDFLAGSVRSLAIPSFRRVFTSVFLFFLAVGVNGSLLLHFLTFYAGITGSGALAVLQAGFHLAAIAGLLVWLRASRAVEKHRLYLLGCVGMAVLMLAAFLLLGEGRPLGTGNVAALLAIYALAGFFGSVVWFLPATMIADVVDQDHLATGRRREGSFFGIFSFGQQLAVGCSLLVSGVLLDAFAGLVPGQATQSPGTRWRIGFACCVVPAALLLSAGFAMLRYELGRRHVRAIQARLSGRSTP